jgi:diguanylate cyclase
MVKQKILVIEDEAPIRANILKILNFKGFETIGAEDGEAGIQQAKRHLPDLIICDIMMPLLDGYGVLYALRQDSETAAIPLVFLTAKAERSDLRQGMNLGADDYLTKPFTSAELLEAVSARLAKQSSITQPYLDEIKRAADNLSRVAYTDPLTNLPNRIFLRHKLQETIGQAQLRQQQVGVLCLNLDRFSAVNASLGNLTGDLLLQAVADRLTQSLPSQVMVSRFSGDEFSLIVSGTTQLDLLEIAQQLLKNLTRPYRLDNQQDVFVHASIGIALFPENSSQPDQLLTQADAARRYCRKQGGNAYQFYNSAMVTADAERRSLEVDLHAAIERCEFLLYYQPQVNAVTGRIVGMEALLRWQHPTRGMVSPVTFIPVAEESGTIIPIGAWALRAACREVKALQASCLTPLRVSVNLSARQFRQKDLVETVAQILEETEFDPHRLVLELTETSVMEDIEGAINTLNAFKAMGIEISIDDFGTGYSSLSYLRRLPIDVLKVDRSFVSQVTENDHDAAIATAVIAMAKSLGLKVIAEGVETEGQLAFLRQHGCYLIQGYLYSPPLPVVEIQKLLVEDKRLGTVTTL